MVELNSFEYLTFDPDPVVCFQAKLPLNFKNKMKLGGI